MVFNSGSTDFGGSGICNFWNLIAEDIELDYLNFSIEITVHPLGVSFINKLSSIQPFNDTPIMSVGLLLLLA